MTSQHRVLFDWVGTYPNIQKLFTFDFSKAKNNSQSFRLIAKDRVKRDILGNEIIDYIFSIGEYRHYTNDPFTMQNIENVEALDDFIDWVNTQDKLRNYPQIPNATVEKIRADRTGSGVQSVDPIEGIALYSLTIVVTYTKEE